MRKLTALLLLLAGPALAETAISPEALLDQLVGGSAVFTNQDSGRHVGIEYFPTRKRSFWRDNTGRCTQGALTIEEDHLCFRYDDTPDRLHCWAPFVADGALAYRSRQTGEVQVIEPVPGLPFDCVDGLTS